MGDSQSGLHLIHSHSFSSILPLSLYLPLPISALASNGEKTEREGKVRWKGWLFSSHCSSSHFPVLVWGSWPFLLYLLSPYHSRLFHLQFVGEGGRCGRKAIWSPSLSFASDWGSMVRKGTWWRDRKTGRRARNGMESHLLARLSLSFLIHFFLVCLFFHYLLSLSLLHVIFPGNRETCGARWKDWGDGKMGLFHPHDSLSLCHV